MANLGERNQKRTCKVRHPERAFCDILILGATAGQSPKGACYGENHHRDEQLHLCRADLSPVSVAAIHLMGRQL
jgi:hypothetical protein